MNVRADRFLTLRLFAPLRRLAAGADDPRLPVLMYHDISTDLDAHRSAYYRTVTAPATFKRQMTWLRDQGYRGVNLSEGLEALSRPSIDANAKPVVITFDDGLKSFGTAAFPVLGKLGFGSTVFVSTGYVGAAFVTGQPCLTAGEIKDLSQAGVEFGSHTVTHPQLVSLRREQIEQELVASRRAIEVITQRPVNTFSYPYQFPAQEGAFVGAMLVMLEQAGYRAGVTTVIGRASRAQQPLLLSRLPINDCDDEALFAAKVQGGYDWLHAGQYMYKTMRRGQKWSLAEV